MDENNTPLVSLNNLTTTIALDIEPGFGVVTGFTTLSTQHDEIVVPAAIEPTRIELIIHNSGRNIKQLFVVGTKAKSLSLTRYDEFNQRVDNDQSITLYFDRRYEGDAGQIYLIMQRIFPEMALADVVASLQVQQAELLRP